jgi:PAS domain-containing protein
MRPRSSAKAAKTIRTPDGHPSSRSSREAQGGHDEKRRRSTPRTITELKQQIARKIAPQQQLLRSAVVQAVFENHSAIAVVCDARGGIILANAAAKQMARMEPEGMLLNAAPSIWGRLLPSECGATTGWPRLRELLEQPIDGRECRLVQSCDTAVPFHWPQQSKRELALS